MPKIFTLDSLSSLQIGYREQEILFSRFENKASVATKKSC